MFDCIIVGAGPAGSTAAYRLAKHRRSVAKFAAGRRHSHSRRPPVR
ncbi:MULTISPECIES: NAD(P)-binding protein [unclassified Microcoleus]